MSNEYYTPSGWPGTGSAGDSQPARAEMALVQAGFGKLPGLVGNGGFPVRVNAGGTALEAITPATLLAAIGASPSGTLDAPSGTVMLFQQLSAPTGWTKLTTNNDAALRVVSGTPGTGGSVAFSTAFNAANTVDGHAITQTEMPAHTHTATSTVTDTGHTHTANTHSGSTYAALFGGLSNVTGDNSATTNSATTGITVATTNANTGGGATHSHTLANLAVKYVDVIAASKN